MGTLLLLALLILVGLGVWWFRSAPKSTPSALPIANRSPATETPIPGPPFSKLIGRWIRPDGGYVLEIRGVEPTGKLEAAYSNPRPIHVSRAEASREGSTVNVFVELRDVNYPGSTYTLTYEAGGDRLSGIYFQAAERQQFEVYFERMQ